jgi:hypothetical protein
VWRKDLEGEQMMGEDLLRARAIKRVWMKRLFWLHSISYAAGSIGMLLVWAAVGGGYFWPIWPIAGWGVGLLAHGWTTFGAWRISEEAIKREMQNEMRSLQQTVTSESANSGQSG